MRAAVTIRVAPVAPRLLMFQGSIPGPLRAILHEAVKGWDVPAVWVGCSGNLTVERSLWPLGVELHSNDVTLYTSVLGSFFAGKPMRLEIAEEHRDEFGWLQEWMTEPIAQVATILLATRLLEGLGKTNPYFERMRNAYRSRWERLHMETADKLRTLTLSLASYDAQDVATWIQDIPADAPFVAFPPFWVAGYTKLFEGLHAVFDWDAPEFQELDSDRMNELLGRIADRPHWAFGIPFREPALEEHLRGVTRTTSRQVPIYLYTDGPPTRVALPRQTIEALLVEKLRAGEPLNPSHRMALLPLTAPQFSHLRAQYLNPEIAPATPLLSVGVLVGGRLVGAYAILRGQYDPETAYLVSDFPVAPSVHPRLAKLVLLAALSRESQLLVERAIGRRQTKVATTAFTNRPTSMKYRGVFRLRKRQEAKPTHALEHDGERSAFRYQLEYEGSLGERSLAAAYALWWERFAQEAA